MDEFPFSREFYIKFHGISLHELNQTSNFTFVNKTTNRPYFRYLNETYDLLGHVQSPALRLNGFVLLLELDMSSQCLNCYN